MIRTPHFWQLRGAVARILWPFGLIYRAGYALDAMRTHPCRAPLPVIAIGNATVGGAGKTPTTLALAALLQAMGETPHIISRGYGGRIRDVTRVDPAHHTAVEVGDEPLLLAARAPTWIGIDRCAAARAAHAAGASVVLADDAMQHHRLHKDITLMVIDRSYGFGNGYLLPAGPLRLPVARACAQASAFVLIGDHTNPVAEAVLPPDKPRFAARILPVAPEDLAGRRFFAFAGIAHPAKFYATLRQCGGILVQTHDFPDHHPYRVAELEAIAQRATRENLTLITTEKDAVRLPPGWRGRVAALPIGLQWQAPAAIRSFLTQQLDFFCRRATL